MQGIDLKGRRAVVSGASGAIGGAIARELAAEGARLLLLGRSQARLQALAEGLRERTAVDVEAGDLTREAGLRSVVEKLGSEAVDVLVHAAGLFVAGAFETADPADLERQLEVNLEMPYRLTQELLPAVRRARGQIVFVNSSAGLQSRATVGAYGASKHALKGFADALRDELNPDGIRVLSVFPGRTASEMQRLVCEHFGTEYRAERYLQPEDVAASIVSALRLATTAEMTELRIRPMQKI